MCSNYEHVFDNDRLMSSFGVALAEDAAQAARQKDGGMAPFIVRAEVKSAKALGDVKVGLTGRLSHFAADTGFAKQTANCPIETMKSKPAVRESWWAGRRCIVPVERLLLWDWESGQPWISSVQRLDGEPMALAGLWSEWSSPVGEKLLSFIVLTLDADRHEIFGRLTSLDGEKRMPVILPSSGHETWLDGALKDAERLLVRYPAERLQATRSRLTPVGRPEPKSCASVPDMFAPEWHAVAQKLSRKRSVRSARTQTPRAPELTGPTTGDLFGQELACNSI